MLLGQTCAARSRSPSSVRCAAAVFSKFLGPTQCIGWVPPNANALGFTNQPNTQCAHYALYNLAISNKKRRDVNFERIRMIESAEKTTFSQRDTLFPNGILSHNSFFSSFSRRTP